MLQKIVAEQQLTTFRYEPGGLQHIPSPAQRFSAATVAECLNSSRPSLIYLGLFPDKRSKRPAFGEFDQLETMDVPQPGFLSIPLDESDPTVIISSLRKHPPATLKTLSLRNLKYDGQLKVLLEQLAQLKLQGILEHLHLVQLDFRRLVSLPFDMMSPFEEAPNPEALIREDLYSLIDEAGIEVKICQTDV